MTYGPLILALIFLEKYGPLLLVMWYIMCIQEFQTIGAHTKTHGFDLRTRQVGDTAAKCLGAHPPGCDKETSSLSTRSMPPPSNEWHTWRCSHPWRVEGWLFQILRFRVIAAAENVYSFHFDAHFDANLKLALVGVVRILRRAALCDLPGFTSATLQGCQSKPYLLHGLDLRTQVAPLQGSWFVKLGRRCNSTLVSNMRC